jgi:hypothetical protein
MARKKNSPSLLDNISGDLGFDNPEKQEEITNMNDLILGKEDVDDLTEKEPDPKQETEDNKGSLDDNSEIPEEVLNRIENSSEPKEDETSKEEEIETEEEQEEIDPNEASMVGAFFDAFAESLNWDVTDEERPTSIDGIIKYIEDVVEENSKPEYSDERVAQLDQYIRNGGRFEDFYNNQSQSIQYDTLDMEDESN